MLAHKQTVLSKIAPSANAENLRRVIFRFLCRLFVAEIQVSATLAFLHNNFSVSPRRLRDTVTIVALFRHSYD